MLSTNKYGALIERVKRGSAADIEGRLLPGDEVLEWNGHSLQNKTREEVCTIFSETIMSTNRLARTSLNCCVFFFIKKKIYTNIRTDSS